MKGLREMRPTGARLPLASETVAAIAAAAVANGYRRTAIAVWWSMLLYLRLGEATNAAPEDCQLAGPEQCSKRGV